MPTKPSTILGNIGVPFRRSGTNVGTVEQRPQFTFAGDRSTSGVHVGDDTALSLSAYYRGIALLSTIPAMLPLHVYRKESDGKRVNLEDPEDRYLWYAPNDEMTRMFFWETVFAHRASAGDAFIFVEKTGIDTPAALWPIDPSRVRVGRLRSGVKVYEIDRELPMIDYRVGGEIVHLPNRSRTGLRGLSLLKLMVQSIGLARAGEEYASRYFDQADTPGGILSTDQTLSEKDAEVIAARWMTMRAGLARAHRTAVLGQGAKFQQISVNPEDAQLLATREFQVLEFARWLGVPPNLLAATANISWAGAGIEENNRAFVTFSLDPQLVAAEQSVDLALLVRELSGKYVKWNRAALLRGNTLQRYQAHAIAWGRWETTNEIRRDEEEDDIEGGDELMQPANMLPLDEALDGPTQAPAQRGAPPSLPAGTNGR